MKVKQESGAEIRGREALVWDCNDVENALRNKIDLLLFEIGLMCLLGCPPSMKDPLSLWLSFLTKNR